MSDKFLKTRCQILKARYGITITPEELKAADDKMVTLKDNTLAIAELIGEPIKNEKDYQTLARTILMEKTINRGQTGEYPNPIERVADVKSYYLGKNANIESVRVEGAMSEFECHLVSTDNIQISLEEYLNSLYDFIPQYQDLIGETLDKREDYEALRLINAAAGSNLYENCVTSITYADWKSLMGKIDAYFSPALVLGKLTDLQPIVEFTFEGEGGNTDIPVFTPATQEAALNRGVLGSIGTAVVRVVRGNINIAGTSTVIMPVNRVLLVGLQNEVGYIASREMPTGGRRYVQNTPFLPSNDKANPGIFMSMFGLEDLGMVIANSYKVAEFKLQSGS